MVDANGSELILDQPARHFHEAFLLGNGWLGATAYGNVGIETFDLNLDSVWSGGPLSDAAGPDPSIVRELREAVVERDHDRADTLARTLQGSAWTQSFQPLGGLSWSWSSDAATGYSRRLDLRAAVTTVETSDATMAAFVSHPDGVLVAETTGAASFELSFASPHDGIEVSMFEHDRAQWLIASGRAPARVLPNYVDSDEAVTYSDETPDAEGKVDAGIGWAVVALVEHVSGGARLIATAESGFSGWAERPTADPATLFEGARSRIESARRSSTDELRQRHIADYSELFGRVSLDLSPSGSAAAIDAERYFNFGRYLLISSSRPGTQAAHLQGIWNIDVRPGWSSNYTVNINTQMNYWGAELAALGELHAPLFDLTRDLVDAGAETARLFYGSRGSTVHHNTDLWRFTQPVDGDPQWANWSSGLAWLVTHSGTHIDFAWSEGFARDTALPALRAVSEFFLDQLVDAGDGGLVVAPSTSPEHRFIDSAGTTGAVTLGASMDQELAWEVFSRLLWCSDALGYSDELTYEVSRALPQLRLPSTDSDGRLCEWLPELAPTELGHRHLSHLYGMFPGVRITETRTPLEVEAVRAGLKHRLENGSGHTGWSQAWVLCLAARLRDADLASESLRVLVHELSSPSLLDLHPHGDWPGDMIFQIDGNLGAIAGIAELIVQSHDGAIALLPTLPDEWSAGTVSGLRVRGGLAVSIAWAGGQLVRAEIAGHYVGDLVVEVDDSLDLVVTDSAGDPVALSPVTPAPPGRARWQWDGRLGEQWTVTPTP